MTATLRRLQKKKVKMPDSSELLKNIIHYQKSLDRYSQSRDDAKILHCIFKLFNMPVTVTHLEETGIGRTVNSLRKLGGEVEDAAKTLVRKWKDMVSEKDDENEPESRSNGITNREGNENNSSHKHSDRKEKPNKDDKYKTTKKDKYDNHRHQSTSESKHKSSSSKYSKEEEDRNSYESDNDEDNESGVASESEESSMEEEETEEIIVKVSKHEKESGKHSDKEIRHKESSSERSSKHKKDSEGTRKERSHSKEKIRKHESQSEHDHRKRQKRDSSSSDTEQIIKTNKSSSSKRKYEDSASDEEIKKKISKKSSPSSSHRSNSSHRSKESSYEHKKESKSEILDDSSFHKSSHKSKESGSSRDRKEISKSDSNKKESRSSSKSDSKYEKRKLESDKEDNTKSRKEKSGSLGSDKKHSGEKEKSKSKHSSKSSSNSSNTIGSSASAQFVDIGSESGTSFAEALGMLEPTTSKISSKKSKPSLEMVTHHKIEKPERERIKEKPVIEKPSKCDKIDIVIPPPPPKSDLDINIASLLPPITPNYRPVSNPFFDGGCSRNKVMNDDEALSLVMSQKNMRTKVFSGNKCFFGTVPTLFELCIRVLQDNIDALEYTGGVPYAILKPILDKATPDQLFMLEHHNPYLIEDTDEIWKFHCQKEFRNKKREELESWRDMYMRCLDEREAKLKALTENIKLAQDKSTPVRQTKLAYVDSHSVVKPPRDVIRKQAKSGFIDKKPVVTPSSRLSSLATGGATGQVAVPSPPKPSSSSGSSATVKPKKAPLMQKTLQFLKGNRFRR